MSVRKAIAIDPKDNVATAIQNLQAGEAVLSERGQTTLISAIPFGHKYALKDIPKGEYVLKYGVPIRRATAAIRAGEHVHVHNVEDIVDEVRKEFN